MSLDSVFTSSGYNSYIDSTATADTLVDELDGIVDISAWTALTDPQKENVLLESTVDVNNFCYFGVVNQGIISPFNMQWPRIGAFYNNGVEIGSEEIPFFITDYVIRRSVERLSYDENQSVDKELNKNVQKQKVGSLEQSFFKPNDIGSFQVKTNKMPSYLIVKPYVCNSVDGLTYLERT